MISSNSCKSTESADFRRSGHVVLWSETTGNCRKIMNLLIVHAQHCGYHITIKVHTASSVALYSQYECHYHHFIYGFIWLEIQ